MKPEKKYEVVIEPPKGLVWINWREIWQYRDLLFMLVRRDFVTKYKQTILGPLWYIVQPLLTTLVFSVIFGKVARIPTQGVPPILFYLSGLLIWDYFAICLGGVSSSLLSNVGLYSKVYFPRLIIPLSVLIINLLRFSVQLLLFLGFFLYFKLFTPAASTFHFSPSLLWVLPWVLFQTACLSLGLGLLIASITIRNRDFQHLVGFITQLWMYATPIIYPLSSAPEKLRPWLELNPMAQLVNMTKNFFLGTAGEIVNARDFVFPALVIFVLLLLGLMTFTRQERTFIDNI